MIALVEELVRVVFARAMLHLLGIARGRITAEEPGNRTVTVQCAWGEVTSVRVAQPWPDCTVSGTINCDVLIAWPISTGGKMPGAPGELPTVVAFLTGTFSKVTIGGLTPVARKFDTTRIESTTDLGFIAWMAAQDTAAIATDATGAYTAAKAAALAAGQVWPPTAVRGKITSGSDKVEVG